MDKEQLIIDILKESAETLQRLDNLETALKEIVLILKNVSEGIKTIIKN